MKTLEKEKKALPGAQFSGGARENNGEWNPLIDLMEIFAGFRWVDKAGGYDLYDAPVGVKLRIEEADKSEPVLVAENEWEETKLGPVGLWMEDGRYHLLYRTGRGTCYAVSEDGYRWSRPELGQVEHSGSRKNNLVADGPTGGVFEDPNAPPEERFKAMAQDIFWVDPDTAEKVEGEELAKRLEAQNREGSAYKGPGLELRGQLVGWVSPDRLHWKRIEESLAAFSADSGSHPKYDPDTGYYFDYFRVHAKPPDEYSGIGTGVPENQTRRRSIGFSRTKDFRRWPPPKLVLFPDPQDEMDVSFYGTEYFRYPGRNDLHGMFLCLFHQVTDTMDGHIAFSRDGLFWHRPERRPIVPIGEIGSDDACMVYPATGLIELPDGYWGCLYRARSSRHNVWPEEVAGLFPDFKSPRLKWARWRPHRFCGVEAEKDGCFTIVAIKRNAGELRLNYRCGSGGWIKVELARRTPTSTHNPQRGIEGFTFEECDLILGDSLDRAVSWKCMTDITGAGDVIVIRFRMFQSKIFGYRV